MKSLAARIAALAAIVATLGLTLVGAGSAPKHPDTLVILSTTDVKGRTGPCG
jgi:hypothetical protein